MASHGMIQWYILFEQRASGSSQKKCPCFCAAQHNKINTSILHFFFTNISSTQQFVTERQLTNSTCPPPLLKTRVPKDHGMISMIKQALLWYDLPRPLYYKDKILGLNYFFLNNILYFIIDQ